jgi:hypothetical protein
MILVNENNELMTVKEISDLKQEIKNEYQTAPDANEEDLQSDLADYYLNAQKSDLAKAGLMAEIKTIQTSQTFSRIGFGRSIWQKVKKALCTILSGTSTIDEIIDAVLDVLSSIIPGGKILKWLVKKIVRYIIEKTVSMFCAIP